MENKLFQESNDLEPCRAVCPTFATHWVKYNESGSKEIKLRERGWETVGNHDPAISNICNLGTV